MEFQEAFSRFQDVALSDVKLRMTPEQKALIATHHLGTELAEQDFPDVKTAFFMYSELEDELLDAIDEYALNGDEELAERILEGRLVPFAALNQSGDSLAYGQNIFAENNAWGLLCFDLERAEGASCPVLWLRRGKLRPWADRAGDLEVG